MVIFMLFVRAERQYNINLTRIVTF